MKNRKINNVKITKTTTFAFISFSIKTEYPKCINSATKPVRMIIFGDKLLNLVWIRLCFICVIMLSNYKYEKILL